VALTHDAVHKIRRMILSGELSPGSRLPPEQQLAAQMGLSRNGVREAVKVLEAAQILTVRRGDGTYVTSLAPNLLLHGLRFAVEFLRDDTLLEVLEIRRLLEPSVTSIAALRMSESDLDGLEGILNDMRLAADDLEKLVELDAAFHYAVIAAAGNETLTSLLDNLSNRTLRVRAWRGLIESNSVSQTIDEHHSIYLALRSRDPAVAHARALLHVITSESWLRAAMSEKALPPEAGEPPDQRG
jgi:GntR family transcriptional regulator, transcriptional repressor for pyruvate dehydrogenase complex